MPIVCSKPSPVDGGRIGLRRLGGTTTLQTLRLRDVALLVDAFNFTLLGSTQRVAPMQISHLTGVQNRSPSRTHRCGPRCGGRCPGRFASLRRPHRGLG